MKSWNQRERDDAANKNYSAVLYSLPKAKITLDILFDFFYTILVLVVVVLVMMMMMVVVVFFGLRAKKLEIVR
jgi:heme/copper-type cytochrome/quinol oxidase subunit 2